jgi:hypothetical protein
LGRELQFLFSPGRGELTGSQRTSMKDLRLWPILLLVLPAFMQASTLPAATNGTKSVLSLQSRESSIFHSTERDSQFVDLPHAAISPNQCENTRPPEALATPNPLITATDEDDKVIVSFIVGTDGKVHSPLILEGDDVDQDRLVLDAIAHWRYRPATCNGAPTEMEGKVQFSRR